MKNIFTNEEWRVHPKYKNIYISNIGRFKRILKTTEHILAKDNYRYKARINGKDITFHIDTMMKEVFPELNFSHKEVTQFKDLDGEIWKPILNINHGYEVSNKGRVRRLDVYRDWNGHKMFIKGGICSISINRQGYCVVGMAINKKPRTNLVHRLVLSAFVPNKNNYPQVNHIDGNKQNNNVENLEWCTSSQNLKHAYKTGLRKPKTITNSQGLTQLVGKYIY